MEDRKAYSIREQMDLIHSNNKEKGFWAKSVNHEGMREKALLLIHGEVSEASESIRKGRFADTQAFEESDKEFKEGFKLNIKDTYEDELADTYIRLLDLCAAEGIDLEYHVEKKLQYNGMRSHKHGKNY